MMNYAGQCFELEQWFQPFGREATFLEHLRSLAEPWVDECWIDDYGSLIAHQRGDGKCVMVTAQADVQTVVITYIHEDGTARFLTVFLHTLRARFQLRQQENPPRLSRRTAVLLQDQ